jgi:uncharacterized repeat protein (TIGR02543 family)
MKKLSLKALGATLLTAGLVLAGVVAPAHAAATAAWSGSAPTFAVGNTPAMSITFTPTNTSSSDTFRQVNITIKNSMGMAMALATLTSGTASGCKLTSLAGTHVEPQGSPTVGCDRVNGNGALPSYNRIAVSNIGQGSATAYGAFTLQVPAGLAVGLQAGNYTVWVATSNDNTIVESAEIAFTIGAANLAVLQANGGSGTPMSSVSASGGYATLPANTYTKSGFTFAGWRAGSPTSGPISQPGDSVAVSGTVNFYAQWSSGSGGGNSPAAASLTLGATTGGVVAGSTVAITASGLQSTAAYTVVVQSTPQTIGSGNAVGGAVNSSVTIPAGLEAGWHTLTFTSTAADGSAVESKVYFQVSASGTLLATTSTIPAALANTGFDGVPYLASGVLLALAGAVLLLIARRRKTI